MASGAGYIAVSSDERIKEQRLTQFEYSLGIIGHRVERSDFVILEDFNQVLDGTLPIFG
jgi:hypothetical protein